MMLFRPKPKPERNLFTYTAANCNQALVNALLDNSTPLETGIKGGVPKSVFLLTYDAVNTLRVTAYQTAAGDWTITEIKLTRSTR